MRCTLPVALLLAVAVNSAPAQDDGPEPGPIDACGVLIQQGACAVFEGGGGVYVIPSVDDDFGFGDPVRVVGTIDPDCITICDETDGCISGATLYDPGRFPCGTDIPSFPGDIITGVCSGASAALLAGTAAGLWLTRRARTLPGAPAGQAGSG